MLSALKKKKFYIYCNNIVIRNSFGQNNHVVKICVVLLCCIMLCCVLGMSCDEIKKCDCIVLRALMLLLLLLLHVAFITTATITVLLSIASTITTPMLQVLFLQIFQCHLMDPGFKSWSYLTRASILFSWGGFPWEFLISKYMHKVLLIPIVIKSTPWPQR